MSADEYYDVPLEGMEFVEQTIDFGMQYAMHPYPPTTAPPAFTIDPMILIAIGVGVVVLIVVVLVIRRR
jgi:hypothetical protein